MCCFYSIIIISNAFRILLHSFPACDIFFFNRIWKFKCFNFFVYRNKMVVVCVCVRAHARAFVAPSPCLYVTVCGCCCVVGRLGFRRTGFPLRGWEDGSAAAVIQHIPGNQFLYDRSSLPRALDPFPSLSCTQTRNEHTGTINRHPLLPTII